MGFLFIPRRGKLAPAMRTAPVARSLRATVVLAATAALAGVSAPYSFGSLFAGVAVAVAAVAVAFAEDAVFRRRPSGGGRAAEARLGQAEPEKVAHGGGAARHAVLEAKIVHGRQFVGRQHDLQALAAEQAGSLDWHGGSPCDKYVKSSTHIQCVTYSFGSKAGFELFQRILLAVQPTNNIG